MKDIKIYQGYSSCVMNKFQFLKRYNLKPYHDKNAPLVVFGCYNHKDRRTILRHKGTVILRWCGRDSETFNIPNKSNIIHITPLPKVRESLENKDISCHQMKIIGREEINPIPLGNKIYTYLNKNNPKYYGSEIVKKLNVKYEILIGDYSISQEDWYNGECEKYYSQAFVGLALSNYAGGGGSIVEMGLRGIKVITNVLDIPNTIPWKTIEDIEQSIEQESKNIGKTNKELAQKVYDSMIHDLDCFDLNKLIK